MKSCPIKSYIPKLLVLILILLTCLPCGILAKASCEDKFDSIQSIVAKPLKFKNKKVEISGYFYSFSSLPLDYPKAYLDPKKYIGIVLSRPDQREVPLVELKLAAKLELFKEKDHTTNINHGDKIKLKAKVYAVELGEPWLEISSLEVLEKAKKEGNDE